MRLESSRQDVADVSFADLGSEMPEMKTLYIVEDEPTCRGEIASVAEHLELRAEGFPTAEAFLGAHDESKPGCLVLDLRLPGMSGLELQERLAESRSQRPVIAVSAFADVPSAVRVMRMGAVTVLTKPYAEGELRQAIIEGLDRDAQNRQKRAHRADVRARLGRLSHPERAVLEFMLAGTPNKMIARHLTLSLRTIEHRRQQIFLKTQANSLAELVRLVCEGEQSVDGN